MCILLATPLAAELTTPCMMSLSDCPDGIRIQWDNATGMKDDGNIATFIASFCTSSNNFCPPRKLSKCESCVCTISCVKSFLIPVYIPSKSV